jgi:hypothetical protein
MEKGKLSHFIHFADKPSFVFPLLILLTKMSAFTTELTLPTEWDNSTNMITDEELSASSNEEASRVFEQWQSDDDDVHDLDIMQVDEQLGSNLLEDEIFHDPCVSPTGPLEEIVYMTIEDEDVDRFSLSLMSAVENDATSSLPFEERYKATLQKLAFSMKRSQESRKSLKVKTAKTEQYPRIKSVIGVVSSIEKSTEQLQLYLNNIQCTGGH